jgi:hypothetical protein
MLLCRLALHAFTAPCFCPSLVGVRLELPSSRSTGSSASEFGLCPIYARSGLQKQKPPRKRRSLENELFCEIKEMRLQRLQVERRKAILSLVRLPIPPLSRCAAATAAIHSLADSSLPGNRERKIRSRSRQASSYHHPRKATSVRMPCFYHASAEATSLSTLQSTYRSEKRWLD